MRNSGLKVLAILLITVITSSYGGYNGTLPNLDEPPAPNTTQTQQQTQTTTQPANQSQGPIQTQQPQQPAGHMILDQPEVTPPPANEPAHVGPLAPRDFPDVYAGSLIRSGKYSKYLKDLEDIVPELEGLRKLIISDNPDRMQLFCAKAGVINLYVNNLQAKYSSRPERYYESYKQILKVNKNVNETANYWKYTYKYKDTLRASVRARRSDERLIKYKMNNALKSIDTALDLLKGH